MNVSSKKVLSSQVLLRHLRITRRQIVVEINDDDGDANDAGDDGDGADIVAGNDDADDDDDDDDDEDDDHGPWMTRLTNLPPRLKSTGLQSATSPERNATSPERNVI